MAHESIRQSGDKPFAFLDLQAGTNRVVVRERDGGTIRGQPAKPLDLVVNRPTVRWLGLSRATSPDWATCYRLREYISGFRFYSSFDIKSDAMRRPVVAQQEPELSEDASNLSAVLLYLKTERSDVFEELEDQLRTFVPQYRGITQKIVGQGQVTTLWKEGRPEIPLSLADVSDGTLRLICWTLLCILPSPPPLICIDEPELGLHPGTLPLLAALFEKAADRTQVLLATHSSYFLTQFDISNISVMRKEDTEARMLKPASSKALRANLEEFGREEIEIMHRSDELEDVE
jgi:predicted ATPase